MLITPHIFTEFVQHLWQCIDDPEDFKKILVDIFKEKWYIKEKYCNCNNIIKEKDFKRKRLEIGDISLKLVGDDEEKRFKIILTDDDRFARIADKEYDYLVINYESIRLGTLSLNPKNISKRLLEEPIQKVKSD